MDNLKKKLEDKSSEVHESKSRRERQRPQAARSHEQTRRMEALPAAPPPHPGTILNFKNEPEFFCNLMQHLTSSNFKENFLFQKGRNLITKDLNGRFLRIWNCSM